MDYDDTAQFAMHEQMHDWQLSFTLSFTLSVWCTMRRCHLASGVSACIVGLLRRNLITVQYI